MSGSDLNWGIIWQEEEPEKALTWETTLGSRERRCYVARVGEVGEGQRGYSIRDLVENLRTTEKI